MFARRITLDSPTGARLRVYHQPAETECSDDARGILLVHHGLAEHAGRYGAFAQTLSREGFHVYAHDHRGHGETTAPDAPFRRFALKNGAVRVVEDCRAVHERALADHPGLPTVVLGHSMGGMIALNYAERFGDTLAGLAVWNADLRPGAAARIGRFALRIEKALKGSDVASGILQRATFGAWAKSVEPRRTPFDWLSHDEREVDAYVADPRCGFSPTISMMEDVVSFVLDGGSKAGLSMLPLRLPVHLLGGTQDPATENARAMRWLADRLGALGERQVTLEIVAGARHETLNEVATFRQAAVGSLIAWLDRVVAAEPSA